MQGGQRHAWRLESLVGFVANRGSNRPHAGAVLIGQSVVALSAARVLQPLQRAVATPRAPTARAARLVGWGQTSTDADHPFLWSDGKMTDLGVSFFPAAINDKGLIVADTGRDALLNTGLTTLFPREHQRWRQLPPDNPRAAIPRASAFARLRSRDCRLGGPGCAVSRGMDVCIPRRRESRGRFGAGVVDGSFELERRSATVGDARPGSAAQPMRLAVPAL